jgi:hypothetical protein
MTSGCCESSPNGLAQAQGAEAMGVTKSRVSQIERDEVSTIETVARYVQAIPPDQAPSDVRDRGALADLPVPSQADVHPSAGAFPTVPDVFGDRHADGVVQSPRFSDQPLEELVRAAAGVCLNRCLTPQVPCSRARATTVPGSGAGIQTWGFLFHSW